MTLQPRIQSRPTPLGYILEAVNLANPWLPAPLSESNVTAGPPVPMPVPTAAGINTTMLLTAVSSSGYTDAITIYYSRVNIAQLFESAGISPAVNEGQLTDWMGVLNALNASYNTYFTALDIPETPFVDEMPLTITMPPTSLLYSGSITINNPAVPLSTAIAVTALEGLTSPNPPMPPVQPNPAWANYEAGAIVFQATALVDTNTSGSNGYAGLFTEEMANPPSGDTLVGNFTTNIQGIPAGLDVLFATMNPGATGAAPFALGFGVKNTVTGATDTTHGNATLSLIDGYGNTLFTDTASAVTGKTLSAPLFQPGHYYALVFTAAPASAPSGGTTTR